MKISKHVTVYHFSLNADVAIEEQIFLTIWMLHHEFGRSCYLEWLPRCFSDKGSPCQAGDAGSIPGLGRPPREGNDNP